MDKELSNNQDIQNSSDCMDECPEIQELLSELNQAEQASVFQSTPINAAELIESGRMAEVPFFANKKLFIFPAAACFALMMIFGQFFFKWEMNEIEERKKEAEALVNANRSSVIKSFNDCFAGPGKYNNGVCSSYDYDSDGDVDLQDFSKHQVVFASR